MGVLLTLTNNSFAQEPESQYNFQWVSKPIQCGSWEEIIKLATNFGEKPLVKMQGAHRVPERLVKVVFYITMNPETRTWTLIEEAGANQVCILGSGTGNIDVNR